MQAAFTNDPGFFVLVDVRLNNDAPRPPDNAENTVAPIGQPAHPEQESAEGVGITHQLPILVPVLGKAMVGVMHDQVEITREQHEETDHPAKKFVQPAGTEHCPVRQLMLGCVKKIEGNAQAEPRCQNPPATKGQEMSVA